jgi:hypothetical protein
MMDSNEIEELVERLDRRQKAHVFFAERVGVETGRKVHTEASDEYSEICDALRTLLNERRWKPIEEAPRDGTLVDLWITPPKGMITGTGPVRCPDCWHSGGKWWRYDEQHGDDQCRVEVNNATRWMSLPEPPVDEAS